jgi:hypothetical protein
MILFYGDSRRQFDRFASRVLAMAFGALESAEAGRPVNIEA